jgi:hypothetical protein
VTFPGSVLVSLVVALSLVVSTSALARSVKRPKKVRPSYATWQSLETRDGQRVRLLEDTRVTRPNANRHGTVYFDVPDLLPARLELVDGAGKVLDSRVFERPIADGVKWPLATKDETFAITLDYTCGMGSYCGPRTELFRAASGKLRAVETFDRVLGTAKPLVLMQSLKTGWRRERSPDGNGWDILEVVCRPTLSLLQILGELDAKREPKVEFVTAYVRHQYRDGAWLTDWTQRKAYTDILDVRDIARLPMVNGRDPYRSNQGLSLGPKKKRTRRPKPARASAVL